ncbi:hypothetical protein GGI17_006811 [Coemansia sp. S146]|nr:hypothetical protein GGI17_006811 [Coemansia sp. S146]
MSEYWRELERADTQVNVLLKALEQQKAKLHDEKQKSQGLLLELEACEHNVKATEECLSELLSQVVMLGAAQAKAQHLNALQQDKSTLTKKNDELQVKLKGKLRRTGLKANVDKYLAECKKESAAVAAVSLATKLPASNDDQQDSAVADHELKRLQETIQFWQKRTDCMNCKLHAEKVATIEAQHSLHAQQETCQY